MTCKYSPEAITAISNGCSGKLSWLHKKLFGREIACTYCCNEHDLAYFEGGTGKERKLADIRLRYCVQKAGNFQGWRGFFRKRWRFILSWIMYAAVRNFGEQYWGDQTMKCKHCGHLMIFAEGLGFRCRSCEFEINF